MSIYLELLERVADGEKFHIDFKKRDMKVGKTYLIKDGEYNTERELIQFEDYGNGFEFIMKTIYQLYLEYKYSTPSERSESKRKVYFKALSVEELTDEELVHGTPRELAQAKLEGFILCMILTGQFYWKEERLGKWFWQSKGDEDLVILRDWVENK